MILLKLANLANMAVRRKGTDMTRVTATEFKNKVGTYSDNAMQAPVIITSHDRDRLVLMSADEYRRLTDQTADVPVDRKNRTD